MRVCQFRHFRGRVEAPMYAASGSLSRAERELVRVAAFFLNFFETAERSSNLSASPPA